MAAEIIFDDAQMTSAADKIDKIASDYITAAGKLQEEFTSAISNWEGASKDKMNAFMTGPVQEYTSKTIPGILNSLAELLRQNATQMQNVDQQIAENIPNSL